jgi:uncharacterized membrane protein
MEATNLLVQRGEKSVWDKPTRSATLATYDQERWLMAALGSGLMMLGRRRGGLSGGLVAGLGTIVALRAAMGRHDLRLAQHWIERTLTERGWRKSTDIVADASEESFPASDSPSWTAASGATPEKGVANG